MITKAILSLIKLYWLLVPPSKRRKCIFRHSCSQYVFDTTYHKGASAGLQAYKFRYRNCRGGYEMFPNPVSGEVNMILPDGLIITESEISKRLI